LVFSEAQSNGEKEVVLRSKNPLVDSFFYLYTAALFGHPRARFQYGTFYLQNGLLPSKELIREGI